MPPLRLLKPPRHLPTFVFPIIPIPISIPLPFHPPTQCPTKPLLRQPYATGVSPRVKQLSKLRPVEDPTERYHDRHFPMDHFMSAYKSKAITLGPLDALALVKRYVRLRGDMLPGDRGHVEHGKMICEEFNIPPSTLSFLAYILLKSTPPADPYHSLASHLLDLASQLNDPSATIFLYRNISNPSQKSPNTIISAFHRAEMKQRYLTRIEKLAKETPGHPTAMYVWAQHLQSTARNAKERKDAVEWYTRAGEGGMSEAWVKVGEMLKEDGAEVEEVKRAYEKAMDADIAEGYLKFAELVSPFPDHPPRVEDDLPSGPPPAQKIIEMYANNLLKAGASGNPRACYLLALYYLYYAPAYHRSSLMGREWLTVSAHAGYTDAMHHLGVLLGREGKAQLGKEWDDAAGEREFSDAREKGEERVLADAMKVGGKGAQSGEVMFTFGGVEGKRKKGK